MQKRNLLKNLWVIFIGLVITAASVAFGALPSDDAKGMKDAQKKAIIQKTLKLNMPFIANQGQIQDKHVKFYARTFGGAAFVTDQGEVIYSFSSVDPQKEGAKGLSTDLPL